VDLPAIRALVIDRRDDACVEPDVPAQVKFVRHIIEVALGLRLPSIMFGPVPLVAYLRLADNSRGPLLSRQRGLSPPVVRSRNGLSAPYAALLSCLSTHRSCLLTYQSRAVGRSFAWCIRYRTWGCGQGGTR